MADKLTSQVLDLLKSKGFRPLTQTEGDSVTIRIKEPGSGLVRKIILTHPYEDRDLFQTTFFSREKAIELLDGDEAGLMIWNHERRQGAEVDDLISLDLSGKKLREVNLSGLNLYRSQFKRTDLTSADASDSRLDASNFTGATLKITNFQKSNLSGSLFPGADLTGADLSSCNMVLATFDRRTKLENANLENTNLQAVQGEVYFDRNNVRGLRTGSWSNHPWFRLKREYTGPRFIFHLLFLIVFFIPFVLRTFFWVQVSEMESLFSDISSDYATTFLKEGPIPVWRLVLGFDGPVWTWVLPISLIFYNGLRGFLTWFVAPMSAEEDRSGFTPSLKINDSRRQDLDFLEEKKWFTPYTHWWHRVQGSYGWLLWPHKITSWLFWIAALSFFWNLIYWFSRDVYVIPSLIGQ